MGVEREAKQLGVAIDRYTRLLEEAISKSPLSDPLKTNLLTSLDLISYKGLQVIRVRVPRQTQLTFLGDECFLRTGSSTNIAPNTAAPTELPTMRLNMIDDVAIPRSFQPALAWVGDEKRGIAKAHAGSDQEGAAAGPACVET